MTKPCNEIEGMGRLECGGPRPVLGTLDAGCFRDGFSACRLLDCRRVRGLHQDLFSPAARPRAGGLDYEEHAESADRGI